MSVDTTLEIMTYWNHVSPVVIFVQETFVIVKALIQSFLVTPQAGIWGFPKIGGVPPVIQLLMGFSRSPKPSSDTGVHPGEEQTIAAAMSLGVAFQLTPSWRILGSNGGLPQTAWFIVENLVTMNDLRVPLLRKPPLFYHVLSFAASELRKSCYNRHTLPGISCEISERSGIKSIRKFTKDLA